MTAENSSRNAQLMKVKEVAEYLRVHRSTIYRLLRRSAIPTLKIGSNWRFNVEQIDRWRLELRGEVDDSPVKRPSSDSRR
jgi:excisionase family DNA binding protein